VVVEGVLRRLRSSVLEPLPLCAPHIVPKSSGAADISVKQQGATKLTSVIPTTQEAEIRRISV
jgi:hypothetical protein